MNPLAASFIFSLYFFPFVWIASEIRREYFPESWRHRRLDEIDESSFPFLTSTAKQGKKFFIYRYLTYDYTKNKAEVCYKYLLIISKNKTTSGMEAEELFWGITESNTIILEPMTFCREVSLKELKDSVNSRHPWRDCFFMIRYYNTITDVYFNNLTKKYMGLEEFMKGKFSPLENKDGESDMTPEEASTATTHKRIEDAEAAQIELEKTVNEGRTSEDIKTETDKILAELKGEAK